ncbi:putative phytochrome sensor protein [Leptothrix cholodnii SP-6]|uniref:Putative phytochrome sensor protein n=1 Tax=Leptothrix cholodnii (strain ATCC 51168 / LMG 8142 / SP-6) TaxID=395495 RepID=B1Y2Y1_LEPCP|nr:sigma-54-dependent Fis family transcriptional regulator [Leptothrix cholodnii]ACB35637.1 putative phytochrome sensor protein [Leptothrix cholodnii SP-6]
MIEPHQRQMAHAHAVMARGSAMPPDGMPSADILDSWVRCMQTGLDARATTSIEVVEAADLAERRERAGVTRRLARAELETLAQQIAGSNFLLAFADQEGVILDLYADNRFTMNGRGAGIVAGSCWTEALCGTNGLGTALATGRSVAVTGLEHYLLQLGEISCTAAPVRDALGDIVGVLDASSYFESRQRHTQALVQMAATHIENGLLVHQMRARLVLAVHPRPEFIGTLSAGLLAFDTEGRVCAFNSRAASLLTGLELARGSAFDLLFDEPFERFVAKLRHSGQLRLRDALGSIVYAAPVHLPASHPVPRVPGLVVHPTRARGAPAHERPARTSHATADSVDPPPAFVANFVAGFVADDPAVRAAMRTVASAVRLRVPILIHGETGTGKELLAHHAHAVSGRQGEFVAVNCGALPAELFEAELFGYAGGSFTGARREGSAGLIARADGGTLLLDELGELPLALQAALLRFLDDQRVRPVGSTTTRQVDVQLLAATHVDLEAEVQARRFRADLLYRLDTVRVDLPPLRRRSDFGAIAHTVLQAIDRSARIGDDAIAALSQHAWSGNMRELRSVLTRALLACESSRIERADIEQVLPALAPSAAPISVLQQGALAQVLREFERTGHSVSQTSRNLGVSRTTVYRYLREGSAAR